MKSKELFFSLFSEEEQIEEIPSKDKEIIDNIYATFRAPCSIFGIEQKKIILIEDNEKPILAFAAFQNAKVKKAICIILSYEEDALRPYADKPSFYAVVNDTMHCLSDPNNAYLTLIKNII